MNIDGDINSIDDLSQLVREGVRDFSKWGYVGTVISPDNHYILFNYTAECQWKGRWNYFERISRGLILDIRTGDVAARPFDKFFNWGEGGEEPADLFDVTSKLDGSLGVVWFDVYRKAWRVTTRGSFVSEQSIWAQAWWDAHCARRSFPITIQTTLLFEIIYPENRIDIDNNGYEGLVLLGARNNDSGEDYRRLRITQCAQVLACKTADTFTFDSMEAILAAAKQIPASVEGWVVRDSTGARYKIKGDSYKLAHKMMTMVTFKATLEAIMNGTLNDMIEGVPDEFLGQVKAYQKEINDTVVSTQAEVLDAMVALRNQLNFGDEKLYRRDFALLAKEQYPHLMTYLFAALDGRYSSALIYKTAFRNHKETSQHGDA